MQTKICIFLNVFLMCFSFLFFFFTFGCLMMMEGLGIRGYFCSGPNSDSSSSSEMSEKLLKGVGDSRHKPSCLSSMTVFELVSFRSWLLVEREEIKLEVFSAGLCCPSCGLHGLISGWNKTGSAASGSPLLLLELLDCTEGAESALTSDRSDRLPKQRPREEQGNPCMFAE